MEPCIRLSTLGRAVKVGDLYDYFSDKIIPGSIKVLNDSIRPKTGQSPVHCSFVPYWKGAQRTLSWRILHVDSHLANSIEQKKIPLDSLWFAEWAKSNLAESEGLVKVAVYFRVIRGSTALDQQFVESNMLEWCQRSGGVATHLVGEVTLGSEAICVMQKKVDTSISTEAVFQVQNRVRKAADAYFQAFLNPSAQLEAMSVHAPAELEDVTCKIYTNHRYTSDETKNSAPDYSFGEAMASLKEALLSSNYNNWHPIEMGLILIPYQLEVLRLSEWISDRKAEADIQWREMLHSGRALSNHPTLKLVPSMQKAVKPLLNLLELLWKRIKTIYENEVTLKCDQNKMKVRTQDIARVLSETIKWLKLRNDEVEKLYSLLEGTDLQLLDMAAIENNLKSSGAHQAASVLAIKVDYKTDELMACLQDFIGIAEAAPQWPHFPVALPEENDRYKFVHNALKAFASQGSSDYDQEDCRKYILLSTVRSMDVNEGEIRIIDRLNGNRLLKPGFVVTPNVPTAITAELIDDGKGPAKIASGRGDVIETASINIGDEGQIELQLKTMDKVLATEDAEASKATSNHHQSVVDDYYTQVNNLRPGGEPINQEAPRKKVAERLAQYSNEQAVMNTPNPTDHPLPDSSRTDEEDNKQPSKGLTTAAAVFYLDDKHQQLVAIDDKDQLHQIKENTITNSLNEQQRSLDKLNFKENPAESDLTVERKPPVPGHLLIKEIYADEALGYSKVVKHGQPIVLELNAKAASQPIERNFINYDIDFPEGAVVNEHKVIILMGATGSGKSTLINGMINYMLGVQWEDPYRFKCVREDATSVITDVTIKNKQAHSQTSVVTSYTLRHYKGMAIQHSITIVDTPGYGDTKGIDRDKEITKDIQQFLLETNIKSVDAVCFVAASGDSRLTPTQLYILDSVLSIFGSDFKDNIRLLVTFADNEVPPVIAACKAADFPTSSDGELLFSKFNSSVLYANGGQGEEDSFDKLFWDMGQENYKRFFDLLSSMKSKDLKSTRQVIRQHLIVQEFIKNFENELDVCITTIEDMKVLTMKLKSSSQPKLVQKKCNNGLLAYNCAICKKTCEKPRRVASFKEKPWLSCKETTCRCPTSKHDYEDFEWIYNDVATVSTNDHLVKAECGELYSTKMMNMQYLDQCNNNLQMAKSKALSLLQQMNETVQSIQARALRSSVLTATEYLDLLENRVAEDQKPGYETRLQILNELRDRLLNVAQDVAMSTTPMAVDCNYYPPGKSYQTTKDQSMEMNSDDDYNQHSVDHFRYESEGHSSSGNRKSGYGGGLFSMLSFLKRN